MPSPHLSAARSPHNARSVTPIIASLRSTAGRGLLQAKPRPTTSTSFSAHCMAALNGGIKTRTGSVKRPGQELDRNSGSTMATAAAPSSDIREEGLTPVPLKFVVQEAVKRWFEDTMTEAQRGDVKQQALLGQMYAEGYGVAKDVRAAKEWTDKASSRGYRMQGVYCEL